MKLPKRQKIATEREKVELSNRPLSYIWLTKKKLLELDILMAILAPKSNEPSLEYSGTDNLSHTIGSRFFLEQGILQLQT